MKKYIKPSVKVVNLKSSSNIATDFAEVRGKFVRSYLKGTSTQGNYAVSVYANTVSNGNGVEVLPEGLEG